MGEKTILVEIIGNATQFKKELEGAVAKTAKANGSFARMSKAAGIAGLALAGGLAVGLDKSAHAAVGAEAQTKALDQALANAHIRTKDFEGGLKQAESQGHKFGFSNNEIREALTKLVTATKNGHKAMLNLSTAEDFARLRHLSLSQASDTMTRAIAGSSRALKALGIDVPKVTTAQDAARTAYTRAKDAITAHFNAIGKMTPALKEQEHAALENAKAHEHVALASAKVADKQSTTANRFKELTDRVHGQAKSFSDSAAGGMARYHANMENLEEVIGKGVLPALAYLSNKLADVAQIMSEHPKIVKDVAIALGVLAGALIAVGIAGFIAANAMTLGIGLAIAGVIIGVKLLIDHFDAVKTWLKREWVPIVATLVAGPFGLAIALFATNAFGIRDKAVAIFDEIKNAILDRVKAAAGFVTSLPSRVGDFSHELLQRVTGFVTGANIGGWLETKVGELAGKFAALPGAIGRAVMGAASAGWGLVKSALASIFGPVWKFVKEIFDIHSPSGVFQELGANLVHGFVKGMTDNAGKVKNAVWDTFSQHFGFSTPGPPPKDVQDWLKMVQSPTGGGGPGSASQGGLVNQVVQAIAWARSHGWHGSITSGFRTYAEQAALYARYLAGGPLAAPPGHSSHEFGQAIDVSDYTAFGRAMQSAPPGARLFNRLGSKDPVHYSVTGYAQGGIINKPISLLGEAGPEAIIPFRKWDEGWKQVKRATDDGWTQVSRNYAAGETAARERDARNASRTNGWGKISQDQLNEMLANIIQLPPGFGEAFATSDTAQAASDAANTDEVRTAIDTGTSATNANSDLLKSILDAVVPLHDDLGAIRDAIGSGGGGGSSGRSGGGSSGGGSSLPTGGAGQYDQIYPEDAGYVQMPSGGGAHGGGGARADAVSSVLASLGKLSPPPGMHRNAAFWYSVNGSGGRAAPLVRNISGWLEQFTGRGISPAQAKNINEWWPKHYSQIVRGMAKGGIVNRPTFALIGEAGPEAVVPLSGRGASSGGDTYNFNFPNYVGSKEEITDAVYEGLLRKKGRNRSLGL